MREIKFRIWLGGKFSYWGFIPSPYGMGFCGLPSDSFDLHSMEGMQGLCQQFTGLKDKNGKEIYEGDLVNIRNWGRTDVVLHTATIVWKQQTASWQFDPWFDVDEYDRWRNIEVIGNIHEAPNAPRP